MKYDIYLGSYQRVIGRKNAYIKTKTGFIQCEVVGYLYKTRRYQVITEDMKPLNVDKIYFSVNDNIKTMDKIYKTVEQVCDGCGKHFYLKYCSDGTYEYVEEVCDCESCFHPVEGEPSISEWIKSLK